MDNLFQKIEGTIEFHGAKQLLVNINENISLPIEQIEFIPGDIVYLDNKGKCILQERFPQPVIGIVKGLYKGEAYLYIANFGTVCKFIPKIPNSKYKLGDRIVLFLNKDGTITVHEKFSSSAIDDVKCLLSMYKLTQNKTFIDLEKGPHFYTINEVINHDDLDTFTIDPTSSVDFDDAITVDTENKIIYVHIVDIASFTLPDKLKERCLTLYLSNEHTEHLLDEIDAADNFSLVVGKQRKVITVKISMDEDGLVKTYDIYKSTIIVKKRWNYEQVFEMINNNNAPSNINYLAELTKQRSKNVQYNINLPSIRITSNKQTGEVESLITENTNDISHALVATAMILTNLIVSKHLSSKNVKLPNRFHDTLRGFSIPNYVSTGNENVDSFIMVKKFARAYYSIDKKGHFGLDIKDYVHFTSPMRRYADVLVHRILAGYINDNLQDDIELMNQRSKLVNICQDLYIKWKVNRWINNNKDTIYEIWCTSVTKSGILWFMPKLLLDGFLHISLLLPLQNWNFIDDTLVGSDKNTILKIGDKLSAKIDKVNEITGEVNLFIKN